MGLWWKGHTCNLLFIFTWSIKLQRLYNLISYIFGLKAVIFFHSKKSKFLTLLYYSFLFIFTNKLIFPVLTFLVICYHNPPTLAQTCYLVFLQGGGWDTLGTQIFADQHNLWPNYILTCSYRFTLTSAVGKT